MIFKMSKANLCVVAMLATLSISGYCQDNSDGEKRWGQGGRPSEAQVAEWRAKRGSPEGKAAVADAAAAPPDSVAEHRHGGAPAAASSAPAISGKPEEGAHGGSRSGGLGMRSGGAVWLSESPPMRGDRSRAGGARGSGMGGMAGMEMGGNRGGPPVKRLWPRNGSDPQKSGFAREDADATTDVVLVTPRSKPEGEPLPTSPEHAALAFEMPAQGFYRVYLTARKLQGDTLSISVAKAEVANFGHGGDPEEQAQAMLAPRFLESAPIEIVRERKPDEKQFFQLKSGDEQAFVVLQKGLPLQGARVRFVSHDGWNKEALSDEQGRVSFQVIRDYFPPWREFQKRFKATYLVIAEANAAESGSFKEQPYVNVRYQATLSGSYQPSPDDYMSYAWGLGIGLLIVLFCGVAVYLYRRRRVKPFQEVRFDEIK